MQASRLDAFKDFLSAFLVIGLFLFALFIALPGIERQQREELERQYLEDQKLLIRQTVENTALRTERTRAALLASGVEPGKADSLVLTGLGFERYGIDGYGYFFVLDEAFTLLLHPAMKELEGRNLDLVVNSEGVNLGTLFRKALQGRDAAFVNYRWTVPKKGTEEVKTTYVSRIPGTRWMLGAGFYLSDLEESMAHYRKITSDIIGRTQFRMMLVLIVSSVLLTSLSIIVHSRIRSTEKALSKQIISLEEYKRILDESSLVSRTDIDGKITYVNDSFLKTTGYSLEEAIGKSHNIERHPDTPLDTFRELWAAITAGKVWHGVIKNKKADGSSYYKKATIMPLKDESGRIDGFISSGQDITELIEKRRDLENAFKTDPLTGLGNRLHLLEDLERSVDPCLSLLDIEGFAGVNRSFGTEIGDSVLKQMASVIFDFSKVHGWKAYRIHADTFAVLGSMKGMTDFHACIRSLAERIGETRIDLKDVPTSLITRIGFAAKGRESFVCADMALKQAKRNRERLHIFDAEKEDVGTDLLENLRTLTQVREALAGNRVFPVFQPIARSDSGEIVKYECLLRMTDETGKVMMPDSFIEISKKTDLYKKITMRMIEASLSAFQERSEQFSINLTIEDLMDSETVGFLLAEARQKGVLGRLFVEIVETEELRDFERAGEVLDSLKAEGIGIAIDDFGSGYSNFEYLLRLNPEYVKIDRAIVQNLLSDGRARDILTSIVLFAKKSGMKTIAEFIDSEALLGEIRDLGVDFAQGWLIGKASRALPG